MAHVPVEKIQIIIPTEEVSTLMRVVQEHGGTEPIQGALPEGKTTGTTQEVRSATVHRVTCEEALRFLSTYNKPSFLRAMLEGNRAHTTKREVDALHKDTSARTALLSRIAELQQTLGLLTAEAKRVRHELGEIEEWRRFGLPLTDVADTKHTTALALRGSKKALTTLAEKCKTQQETRVLSDLLFVGETTVLAIVHRAYKDAFMHTLEALDIETVSLPKLSETPSDAYTRLTKEEADVVRKTQEVHAAAAACAREQYTTLQKYTELARWEEARLLHAENTPHTTYTATYTAWVPATKTTSLTEALQAAIPTSAYEVTPPSESEKQPTVIDNNAFVTPFQIVTTLYGAPSYKDIDPTPYLAPFFIIFFALCLSDVGYGITLSLLTGIVLLRYHIAPGTRTMLQLLFLSGIASIFAGVLLGGYTGLDPATIHPVLGELQQFDPIRNPLPVFFLSLILGFIHICFGIVLNAVRQIRLKETKDALLDNVPWLYMFAVIALFVSHITKTLPETIDAALAPILTPLIILGIISLILTQGRKKSGIFAKLFFGVLSLYSAVGYFADVLSYSRLLALGLATGALAFSINLIAGFVGSTVPVIGPVILVAILLFGHTLNIVISVLGAFINSARLQFVEFFSKFLTGTNRMFIPFCMSEKDIIMLPEKKQCATNK